MTSSIKTRLYGLPSEQIAASVHKSPSTIYNWAREGSRTFNPALYQAASQYARNMAWSPESRKSWAIKMTQHIDSPALDHRIPSKQKQQVPLVGYYAFMMKLSGVDLWHLAAASHQHKAIEYSQGYIHPSTSLIETCSLLQVALAESREGPFIAEFCRDLEYLSEKALENREKVLQVSSEELLMRSLEMIEKHRDYRGAMPTAQH